MTPTPELEAAARLLAVLEGAKAAALALADAHLPPGRAMALRAAAFDPATSLWHAQAADARAAALFLAALRGAARGHAAPVPTAAAAPLPARAAPSAPQAPAEPSRPAPAASEPAPPPAPARPVAPPSIQERGAVAASIAAALGLSKSPLGGGAEPPLGRAEPAAGLPGDLEQTVQAPRPVSLAELLGSRGSKLAQPPRAGGTVVRPGPAAAPPKPSKPPEPPEPTPVPPPSRRARDILVTLQPIDDSDFVDDDGQEVTQVGPSLGASRIGISTHTVGPSPIPSSPASGPSAAQPAASPTEKAGPPPARIASEHGPPAEDLPEVGMDMLEEISEMEEYSEPVAAVRVGPPAEPDEEPSALMAHEDVDASLGTGIRAGPAALQIGKAQRPVTRPIARPAPSDHAYVVSGRGEELPLFGVGEGEADEVSLTYDLGPEGQLAAPRLTEEGPGIVPIRAQPGPGPSRAEDAARVAEAITAAQAALAKGDIQRAIQFYSDAIQFDAEHMDAYIGRGRCHLEVGDYSSAMSDFQRAEDLAPTRPEPAVAMGDLFFARKEYKRAIDLYDHAIEMDASHAMARCRRGISYYYRKNYKQAFQDLQRAFALDPEIPNIKKYIQMAVKKMEGAG